MKHKKWIVVEWEGKPEEVKDELPLDCPHCGNEAMFPIGHLPGGMVIAATGLDLIMDPAGYRAPAGSFPGVVKCPRCRCEFGHYPGSGEVVHVR